MATSVEILQQRITNALTNLEDVKVAVIAQNEQQVTPEQINQEFDNLDAKIDEIKNIVSPQ